ncbi:TPA: 50S ribosomal protein L32 [Patescibacteria group bacterium]|uniref:Large ribosomal subunit protein bL32 n=1 Tax=candidate division Kazan bacterium GW2011_GWA1_44_22 TaxID=1620410 RepID=A0A0G1KX69_UNCK3|nr:MAG: 50S ribosomal protein L32 [candidate division Kazan bacterium GW2011_GWA1_44_22]HCR42313.1 50S ribosomal protein L32 [Patescibacteria group bacterium]
MAAQPKKKISRVRGRTRRAHQARKFSKLPTCPQCHQPKPGHIICPECGYYAGKKLLHTKTDQRIGKQLIKARKAQATAAKKAKTGPTKAKSKKDSGQARMTEDKAKMTEIKAEKKAKSTRTTDEVKASKVKNK